jgi:hypothetical protein
MMSLTSRLALSIYVTQISILQIDWGLHVNNILSVALTKATTCARSNIAASLADFDRCYTIAMYKEAEGHMALTYSVAPSYTYLLYAVRVTSIFKCLLKIEKSRSSLCNIRVGNHGCVGPSVDPIMTHDH